MTNVSEGAWQETRMNLASGKVPRGSLKTDRDHWEASKERWGLNIPTWKKTSSLDDYGSLAK